MALHIGNGHSKGHLNRLPVLGTVVPAFPAQGSVADYDFKNGAYSGPALSVVNASGGYVDDSQGNWSFVAPNTLRRSNKGVLVEGAQTNSIRNNSMQGAVAGSPGTAPTNWSINGGGQGVVSQIVGSGTDQGIDYLDVRFTGTSASTSFPSILPDTNTGISALTGQLWSHSVFMKQIAGTSPPWSVQMSEKTSGGASVVNGNNGSTDLTSSWQRITYNRTLSGGATVAALQPIIACTANSGQTYDFTIRIGWPQLEQWSTSVTTVGGASSPIRTTGTAATRAADALSATLDSPVSAGTIVLRAQPAVPTINARYVTLGSNTDRIDFRSSTSVPDTLVVAPTVGNTGQAQVSVTSAFPVGVRSVAAAAFAPGDTAISVGGAAPSAASPVSTPSGMTAIRLGIGVGGNNANSYIERLVIYPYRATNSNLQQMSTLANWGG